MGYSIFSLVGLTNLIFMAPDNNNSNGNSCLGTSPIQMLNEGVGYVKATDLLGTNRVLRIEHNGSSYLLRLTKNDKLILTK